MLRVGSSPTIVPALCTPGPQSGPMRGLPFVLTVAFVFASSALLVGPASAQQSTEPSEPDRMPSEPYEPYEQPPTDAVLEGRVTDGSGNPVDGALVGSYNHGAMSYEAEDAARQEPVHYGGNS